MRNVLDCLIALSISLLLGAPASEAALLPEWREPLLKAEALIEDGKYEKAERLTQRTVQDILDRAGTGTSVSATLASAVVLRAVATVGTGDEEYGIWLWHTALNILPEMQDLDLAKYGPPGRVLAEYPLDVKKSSDSKDSGATEEPESLEEDEIQEEDKIQEEDNEVLPPKVVKNKKVKYPRGARAFRHTGKMAVLIIIDSEGRPHSPVIVDQAPAPTLAYSVLETIRQWKYEPATLDGEPVSVYYHLTVNFSLGR